MVLNNSNFLLWTKFFIIDTMIVRLLLNRKFIGFTYVMSKGFTQKAISNKGERIT
jgi:hypothetical protein